MADGNLQKYRNPNPLQQFLLRRFLDAVTQTAHSLHPEHVLDVGCAEGFVLNQLQSQSVAKEYRGVDIDEAALARGHSIHPDLQLEKGSVFALPFDDDSFDLVLCLEVLEHLEDPSKALEEIKRVSRRYCIVSVPHEPYFRLANFLRGKNMRRFGNDIEHINHWGAKSFRRFLEKNGLKVRSMRMPFPWLLASLEH